MFLLIAYVGGGLMWEFLRTLTLLKQLLLIMPIKIAKELIRPPGEVGNVRDFLKSCRNMGTYKHRGAGKQNFLKPMLFKDKCQQNLSIPAVGHLRKQCKLTL